MDMLLRIDVILPSTAISSLLHIPSLFFHSPAFLDFSKEANPSPTTFPDHQTKFYVNWSALQRKRLCHVDFQEETVTLAISCPLQTGLLCYSLLRVNL